MSRNIKLLVMFAVSMGAAPSTAQQLFTYSMQVLERGNYTLAPAACPDGLQDCYKGTFSGYFEMPLEPGFNFWGTSGTVTQGTQVAEPHAIIVLREFTWTDPSGEQINGAEHTVFPKDDCCTTSSGVVYINSRAERYSSLSPTGGVKVVRTSAGGNSYSYEANYSMLVNVMNKPGLQSIEFTGIATTLDQSNGFFVGLLQNTPILGRRARLKLVFDPTSLTPDGIPGPDQAFFWGGLLRAEIDFGDSKIGGAGFGSLENQANIVLSLLPEPGLGMPAGNMIEFRAQQRVMPNGVKSFVRYGCTPIVGGTDAAPSALPIHGTSTSCYFGITAYVQDDRGNVLKADNYFFTVDPNAPTEIIRNFWSADAGVSLMSNSPSPTVHFQEDVSGNFVNGQTRAQVQIDNFRPPNTPIQATAGAVADLNTQQLAAGGFLTTPRQGDLVNASAHISEVQIFHMPFGVERVARYQLAVEGTTTLIPTYPPSTVQAYFPFRWWIATRTADGIERNIYSDATKMKPLKDNEPGLKYREALVIDVPIKDGTTVSVTWALEVGCFVTIPPAACESDFAHTAKVDVLVPEDVTVESSSNIFKARTIVDVDDDHMQDDIDNCPAIANADQADADLDRIGDACDSCPETVDGAQSDAHGCSAAQRDTDHDGVTDDLDSCPESPLGKPVDSTGCPPPKALVCDVDIDADVDRVDLDRIVRRIGQRGVGAVDPADINRNQRIDLFDPILCALKCTRHLCRP